MSITLKVPKPIDLKPRITVIGVGGAGGNAVNNMIAAGLAGVDFVVANTDAQALAHSHAPRRLQLGVNLTEGLGAGSRAEVGEEAAREATEEIRAAVAGSHMLFIAAGMGGGTGSGAAAVIGAIARELGVLTVAVVTKPFTFEGTKRMRTAEAGVAQLKKVVDTLIVIPNQNLFRLADEKTTMAEAFVMADQVLYSGIACIVDLIVKEGLINLDLADVRAVLSGMGPAVMGTGEARGERRAMAAAKEAVSNQLLDNMSLAGAKGLLISIIGGRDLTLFEVDEAATLVRDQVDPEANIIVGAAFDETLGDAVRVSIVASGMPDAAARTSGPTAAQQTRSVPDRPTSEHVVEVHAPAEAASPLPVYEPTPAATVAAKGPPPLPADFAAGRDAPVAADDAAEQPYGTSDVWYAPGPQVATPSALPVVHPPLGTARSGGHTGHGESAKDAASATFVAQPPVEVRRVPSKVPPLDQFPAVGQREYLAKTGAAGGSAPRLAEARADIPAEPRKGSLFKRLADAARGRSGAPDPNPPADDDGGLPPFMAERKRPG